MNKERALTEKMIGAAMEVHDYWGPGLIESIYAKSLALILWPPRLFSLVSTANGW